MPLDSRRQSRVAADAPLPPHVVKRAKTGLIVLGALLLALVVFLLVQAFQEESADERWDLLASLRNRYEPRGDALFDDPGVIQRNVRLTYLKHLDKFLEEQAKKEPDALEPFVRFLIAKTEIDLTQTMQTVPFAERAPHYDRAIAELEVLRDRFPDFPSNRTDLRQQDVPPTTTRALLDTMRARRAWDEARALRETPPASDVVVLVRTDRGDMRFGLYSAEAPELVKRFLEKATAGAFDGTAVYEKIEAGDAQDPQQFTLRGGDAATRGAKAYDKAGHVSFGQSAADGSNYLLPAESRNRIPHGPGILAAWHPKDANAYDYAEEFLLVVRRSPVLDYAYSPIGKTLDEASVQTMDRIFQGKTWRQDREVLDQTNEYRNILDFLQVPTRIVKVLVYRDGALQKPEGAADANKAAADETESSLSTVKPDQYKAEVPAPPEEPKEPTEPKEPAKEPAKEGSEPAEGPAPPEEPAKEPAEEPEPPGQPDDEDK